MEINFSKTEVNIEQLTQEIGLSTITVSLSHIEHAGSVLIVVFKAPLTLGEQDTLSSIVSAHVPVVNRSLEVNVSEMPAIASKRFKHNGALKNLFKRVHGIKHSMQSSSTNEVFFACPYPWAKFLGIEFFNAVSGDSCSLEVYDDSVGTYTGIPNFKLNQFGFNANVAKDFYAHKSEFDADIYLGMILKITYSTSAQNEVGMNFIMNEVKNVTNL